MSMKKTLILLGTMLLLAVVLAACGGKPEPTAAPTAAPVEETPAPPVVVIPNLQEWEDSGHNAVNEEPFRHWDADTPAEVPTSCAKCHTDAGYKDYLGADGSAVNAVDAPVPASDAQ